MADYATFRDYIIKQAAKDHRDANEHFHYTGQYVQNPEIERLNMKTDIKDNVLTQTQQTPLRELSPEEVMDEAISKMSAPWEFEPDEYDFAWHGYKCLAKRNMRSGAWCGYVVLPEDHPFNVDIRESKRLEIINNHLVVHQGVTFYDNVLAFDSKLIGFDCNHSQDYAPILEDKVRGTYRTLGYVKKELKSLVEQLITLAEVLPPKGFGGGSAN